MCLGIPHTSAQVRVTDFDGTKLTWTNSAAPAVYKVEYSTNLTRPWVELMTMPSTNEKIVTVDTPKIDEQVVLFRVVWSDAPASNPVGTWVYEGYEGNSLTVTGLVTIASVAPFSAQLSFKAVVKPRPDHLLGDFSSEDGGVNGNQVGISIQDYLFGMQGQIVMDEINGEWSHTSPGIGFPIPTPPKTYRGTFRATRAP
jgi:hypothetical protein